MTPRSPGDRRLRGWLVEGEPIGTAVQPGGAPAGSLVDCMIAATAVRAGAALATRNPADFRRFQSVGLRIVGD